MLQLLAPMLPSLVKSVTGLIDDVSTSDEERATIQLKAHKLAVDFLSQTENSISKELEAKQKIITSEMQSGDAYTKRARPSVVYFGLAAIALNHIIAPWIFALTALFSATPVELPTIELPTEFWWAWSGTVSIWFLGRSAERRGLANKLVQNITGTKV